VCFWTSAFRPVLAVEYVRRSGYFAAEVEFANNRQLSPKPVNLSEHEPWGVSRLCGRRLSGVQRDDCGDFWLRR
jgi:hypothetical protein